VAHDHVVGLFFVEGEVGEFHCFQDVVVIYFCLLYADFGCFYCLYEVEVVYYGCYDGVGV